MQLSHAACAVGLVVLVALAGCSVARQGASAAIGASASAVKAGAATTAQIARTAGTVARELATRDSNALCWDARLLGKAIGRVDGPGVCGIDQAVQLTSVAGVPLSQPSVMDCNTARTFADWVQDAAGPTYADEGGVAQVRVAAHYVCRTRNHQPGAKVSEHGKGKAVDVSALTLGSGRVVTVLDGWRDPNDGPRLRRLHGAACGPFGTVLGPESDQWHQSHFHFDTASHRGGSYCR